MANRRMFAKTIVRTDTFLDMPQSTQNLYFQLGIEADDDGFVSPKVVMRMLGSTDDDLKLLIAKEFAIPFEDGVIVITHWKVNNDIRTDRYKPTIYQDKFAQLELNEGVYSGTTSGSTTGMHRIGEDRLGKDRLGNGNSPRLPRPKTEEKDNPFWEEFWTAYPNKVAKAVALKSWNKLNPDEELKTKILTALETHKKSAQWVKNKGAFIPHPSTWINQRRWEDEIQSLCPELIQAPVIQNA